MARIKTTPMVRFALWALRIYLLVLLTLIGIKFAHVFYGTQGGEKAPAAASVAGPTNRPAKF
jgi:hypothetical protein